METNFYELVFDIVKHIPKGRVTSYGAIAKALGTAKSSRMVGYAMNLSHKHDSKIPAHRVVNRNGLLTGKHHFNNINEMQSLLEAEGIKVVNDSIVNFKTLFWDPITELNV